MHSSASTPILLGTARLHETRDKHLSLPLSLFLGGGGGNGETVRLSLFLGEMRGGGGGEVEKLGRL